jgi:hypothetical protein
MTRKKKLNPTEQAQREIEALASPVSVSGEGEDAAVKALLSPEFEQMTNMDAAQVALILQQIVRGQNSLLTQNSLQIAKIMERQEAIDNRVADELAANRKFIEEVLDRAESLKQIGIEQDKLIANGMAVYQQAKHAAVADMTAKNIAFRQKLIHEKKVTIVSPGQLVTMMEGGQQVAKIIPEEIHVKDIHMRLPVGEPVELPETLAAILSDRRKSQKETAARRELLSKNLESTKLAAEWGKIEGSRADAMPI